MSEERISLLPLGDALTAADSLGIVELKAQSSVYRALLHRPTYAKAVTAVVDALMSDDALDARLRELVVMRIGWVNGGVNEWSQHWHIAQIFGVDETELVAVREWEAHDHWSPADRTALRATDEFVTTGTISNETWGDCAISFPTDGQRLALVATIASWTMMSQLVQCLEVPLDDGLEPWPPDGRSPRPSEREGSRRRRAEVGR